MSEIQREADPYACPECQSRLPEKYRIDDVQCPTCGEQVCHTGIHVMAVSGPGPGCAKIQLHQPYWLPVLPSPSQLAIKRDKKPDTRKKKRDPRPRDLGRLCKQWKQARKLCAQGDTQHQAALQICEGNAKRAQALLRKLRRYRQLLPGGD